MKLLKLSLIKLKKIGFSIMFPVAFLVTILLFSITGCVGKEEKSVRVVYRGEGGTGSTNEKINPPIGIKWKLRLQEGGSRERHFNPPIVYKNLLFFGSSDSNFYALDINTGFMRWVYKTNAPVNSVPYADEEKVYFGSTDGFIYAVYHKTGELAWKEFTGYPVNSTVIGYEDMIVFITDGGSVHFFSKDGIELEQRPNYVWEYNSFQINNGVVYFMPGPPEDPFSLGAYDIIEKRFLWRLPTTDDGLFWYSFPAVTPKGFSKNGVVHFAACGLFPGNQFLFEYFALDAITGEIIWRKNEVSEPLFFEQYSAQGLLEENVLLLDYMAPVIWKDKVIYCPGDNTVKAFNIYNGNKEWETFLDNPTSSAPAAAGGRIYFGTRGSSFYNDMEEYSDGSSSQLLCVDSKNGKILWEIETEGDILGSPVITDKWIIFGTDENYLYVLEELF